MHSRPLWDDIWIQVAKAVSQRSLCIRAQVGAVIVDPDNRIRTTGYNGPPSGFQHNESPCDIWCSRAMHFKDGKGICTSLHAEANAILMGDKSTWKGGVIYTTSDICFECAKLIANSGLSEVVVLRDDTDRSYRDPERSYIFLDECGIDVIMKEE